MSIHNFSNFENLNTLFTTIGNKLKRKLETVNLTQAQYDALTPAEKMNGKAYFITDAESGLTPSSGNGGSTVTITTKIGTDTVLGGQFLTIDGVETLISGTGWMEKTQTLSTSANNVFTFTNAAITTDSSIDPYTNIYDMYPTDIQLSAGQCQVIFDPYDSAVSMSCKIYIK